jgi:hypothetical protein
MKDDDLVQYHPLAEIDNARRPLISKLLRNPLYRKIYIAHLRTIVTDYLQNDQWLANAQVMLKEIDPLVKQDSLKLYSYDDFKSCLDKTMISGPDNIIGLRQLMGKRSQFLAKHALLNKVQPTIEDVMYAPDGAKIKITAKLTNAKAGWLMYRKDKMFAFTRTAMFDDGTNGDATAGDGIFTGVVDGVLLKQYYIVGEGEEGASTMPERASKDYYIIE